MYLMFTIAFMVVGGILALIVRSQLAWSNNDLISQDKYNQFFTMHASTMLFLFIIPVGAGFGNYVLPLMIGAKDMAYPRINALSLWLIPLAALDHVQLLLRRRRQRAGRLDQLPAADQQDLPAGPRHRPLDPRRPDPRHLVRRRWHQLPRDHDDDARALA